MHKIRPVFLITLSVIALSFLLPSLANAQVGISLYPIKFNVTIAPGETYSDTLTVINPNDFPIGVQPEVENIAGGNQGSIDLVQTEIPHGLTAWINISRTEFTLAPQERRQVPFSITVPQNGEPGGHYGAILFRGLTVTGNPASSGVGISGRVGSVVLVNVPGASYATGNIADFTGPGSYLSHGPAAFSFTVNNTGNTHFNPEGQITLTGPLFGTAVVPFESGIVFPGYDRTFTAALPSRYLFGPFTATLSLNIPQSGVQTATLHFFAFPWQEAAGLIVLLVILLFVLHKIKKNFKIVRVQK